MKGKIILKALELIGGATIVSADLIVAFLDSGYGASVGKIEYEFGKLRRERAHEEDKKRTLKRQHQRFYNMLYRLRQDGLVEKNIKNGQSSFRLTRKGKQRLAVLRKNSAVALPDYNYCKNSAKDGKFTIIVFDIPENERRKRTWLRSALKNLGFELIQKSVWIGRVKMSEEFLDDLKNLNLVEYVEIFEISKTGSLSRQII